MRKWLKLKRNSLSISQHDVAMRSGVTQQMYNYIENGNRSPSVETAKKIAEVLDFEWTEFFPDENKVG